MVQPKVTTHDLDSMKDGFMEGMQISTPLGKATLLHKYKNFAQTDKGNWKWMLDTSRMEDALVSGFPSPFTCQVR